MGSKYMDKKLQRITFLVEVHTGATFALRGAPINDVRGFRHHLDSRLSFLKWLENQGMIGVATQENPMDHYVSSCEGALAAWHWHNNNHTSTQY